MSAGIRSGSPWGDLQGIMDMIGANAKTNAQVYRNGPEAMRAWLATGSRLSFDEWLKSPAAAIPTR